MPELTDRERAPAIPDRCWVLHPDMRTTGGARADERLSEAAGLAAAIDLDVAVCRSVPVRKVHPAALFGPGTVRMIADDIAEDQAELAVVNTTLSPVQQRNLERAWHCKVLDRTGLILEIFGARARTREGRLQVELAALTYQRSRLVRSWTHLERQRGGRGFLAGPGESQIEADRRQIDQRITRLKRQLEQVARRRGLHREARARVPYPIVALVGYTNAGKSTLFNRLTGAEVLAEDKLFATLDPTMRAVSLPSGRTVILSDTVGFISDLPTDLVAAFRATLEEVVAADLILHVRDISQSEHERQKIDVEAVLHDLDPGFRSRLLEVRNKIDLLVNGASVDTGLTGASDHPIGVSALVGTGSERLLAAIDQRLGADRRLFAVELAPGDGKASAWLYRHGQVTERKDDDARSRILVQLDEIDVERFRRAFPTASAHPHNSA